MSDPISIVQIMHKLKKLEEKSKRFTSMIGYKSLQTIKTLKSILTLSTSISIVFLYHNLLQLASQILKQGLCADVQLFFKGQKKDKKWPGRIILYCNLSYLLLKVGDHPSSLKFLYDSEQLLLETNKLPEFCDYKLASSIIGFICTCRLGKIPSAHDYLESATEQFNNIIREEKVSKYTVESCSNLYTLLTFAGEIMQNSKAFNNFTQFSSEMTEKLRNDKNKAAGFIKNILKTQCCDNGLEVLCLDSWAEFLYLVVFFPLIRKNTPILDVEEILKEKSKSKRKMELSGILTNRKKVGDAYSFLMKSALQSLK